MRWLFASIVLLAFAAGGPAQEVPQAAVPAVPDVALQRELLEESRRFLQSAKASLDRLGGLSDGLLKAAYLTGVKDGGLAAAIVLVALYLLFLHAKKP